MKTELLAPAGSMEALKAAVSAGADAVYLGGAAFGARAYAKNLDEQEILSAIDYVHLRNRKLYLTVNTLLKEEELEEKLYPYLRPYYEQGLDAVIVQDMGVLKAVRSWFPDLDIHASTQMTVTGSAGARFLESLGATRVVPARELSFAEIQKIHRTTNLEIECFVHGALCYCYSGQCLFSSLIGGRSGNRGRCAQPCRLPYEAYDKDNHRMGEPGDRYPLSPKDMCTVELLPEIVKSGIMSLKIEGRMKKPEYTAGVVSIYRKYLDLYEKKPSRFHVLPEDMKKLYELYNRDGFNKSYYTVRNGRDMMALKNEKEQENKKKQRRNEQLFYEIQRDYIETEAKEPISGFLTLYPGQPAFLSAESGKYSVTAEAGMVEPAKKQPLTEERAKTQLEKTGETPFYFKELDVCMDDNCFVPMQTLNELRRGVSDQLVKEMTEPYRRKAAEKPEQEAKASGKPDQESRAEKKMELTASAETRAQWNALLEIPEITAIYAGMGCFKREIFEEQAEKGILQAKELGKQVYLMLPHVVREGDLKEYRDTFRCLKEIGLGGFLIRNLESFSFLKEMGMEKDIRLDYSVYTYNSRAQAFWQEQGVQRDTVPYELNEREIGKRDNTNSEMVVYGYLPMMVSAQCVQKNLNGCNHSYSLVRLKDRMGKYFPVKSYCTSCYSVIYNSLPLGLVKEADEIRSMHPAAVRLNFTIETLEETKEIAAAFAGTYCKGIGVPAEQEYTKGHFRRKVE